MWIEHGSRVTLVVVIIRWKQANEDVLRKDEEDIDESGVDGFSLLVGADDFPDGAPEQCWMGLLITSEEEQGISKAVDKVL
ncbi:hypothetical protein GH714_033611 [Hevea brasiliensis]|uniref:Uncharacterized protein n=1 Tax=Hevea brasiliensis TaxID=3981 RepID=A0A6A6MP75_HEVBR|nr:hypothetical protein GH714_033611 [Hevea brasiliensis]